MEVKWINAWEMQNKSSELGDRLSESGRCPWEVSFDLGEIDPWAKGDGVPLCGNKLRAIFVYTFCILDKILPKFYFDLF